MRVDEITAVRELPGYNSSGCARGGFIPIFSYARGIATRPWDVRFK